MKYENKIKNKIEKIVNTFGIDCYNFYCNNGGIYPCEPDGHPEQCEFCWTNPKSKFNLEKELKNLIELIQNNDR